MRPVKLVQKEEGVRDRGAGAVREDPDHARQKHDGKPEGFVQACVMI